MLKKLLKYDLKFIFKYWWIAAVVSLSLSVAGGFCIRLLESSANERELPAAVESSASSVLFLAFIVFIAFASLPIILIFIRFYQNFFSDEGYLTFTLPVKRSSLLNSKIITCTLTEAATVIMITVSVCLMLIIGFWEDFWSVTFWKAVLEFLKLIFGKHTLCRIAYVIEALLLCTLSIVLSNLFLFNCITYASIITKKARVITSIGIYFGINMVVSFILQIFALFGIGAIVSYFGTLSEKMLEPVICLALLGVILFLGILCAALYALQYRMLDRKLNLT